MAPETLQGLQANPGDLVRVITRRGMIELAARIDPKLPSGLIFVPFCFFEAPANYLTNPALDPYGKIPELKFSAARIEIVEPVAAE
jgi:formate dehydrogenase major subunit